MNLLTKSKYLIGLQCPKYLWTIFHEKDKIPEASVADEFKFKEGDKVGQMAKMLFPEGIDLPVDNYKKNLEDSEKALKDKKPLFEVGFGSTKRKYGASVNSKTTKTTRAEVYGRLLTHNLFGYFTRDSGQSRNYPVADLPSCG